MNNIVKGILLFFILSLLVLFLYDMFTGNNQIDPKAINDAIKAAGSVETE